MARPISDLAKNDQIPFSEIDFSEDPDQETELYSTEEPHYGRFMYDKDDNTVQAFLEFDTSLAEDCKRVIKNELADDNVDLEEIDWGEVVFEVTKAIEDLVDNATEMNLAVPADCDDRVANFCLFEVFSMDEKLSGKREDFNKINEIIWLQSDESRQLAIDVFHEQNPDIELV